MKKIKLSEEQLTKLVKQVIEQNVDDKEVLMALGDANMIDDSDIDIENELDIEGGAEQERILTPEEIIGLHQDQINQLQDRVQYMEELNADILEFITYQMKDLENIEGAELRKSKQKLRALETRAGREIFWLKSRRL